MAAAIAELWPNAKFGVGPHIENGFYYDVVLPDQTIKESDLGQIERVMKRIKREKRPFQRRDLGIMQARELFAELRQEFKVELIELLRTRGATSVAEETGDANALGVGGGIDTVSVYEVDGFIDLCRGPHVENTSEIGHFKLDRLAGAYWRGNENNPQLQRIYGLCFESEEELAAEVERLEQIKLRDHRKIGREMGIFHLSVEVGPGLPLWLPNGTAIRDELEFLAKTVERKAGYKRVATPHITHEALYYQSGHLPYYREDMYSPIKIDEKVYFLRPMNCPHHHHVYLSSPRSYRDLPFRIAEYGQVYRYEKSGALSGTMRTRGFCQNDAHIYCAVDQAKDEFMAVMHMHAELYRLFGIENFYMRLSLPDLEKIDKYVDRPEKWLEALQIIRTAMAESGLPYREAKGEAAFYGPKIDFIIRSVIGVEAAISTNQLDFLATERFNLTYTGPDGSGHPVYVIHRAPLGSHERFIAFLTEHYAGKFPFWLAPVQAKIIPISDRQADFARSVKARLDAETVINGSGGFRCEVDLSDGRMQKKIRSAILEHVPLILVLGEAEASASTASVRMRDGTDYGQIPLEDVIRVMRRASEERTDEIFRQAWG
jgi:threonyl-tRNA synthetase